MSPSAEKRTEAAPCSRTARRGGGAGDGEPDGAGGVDDGAAEVVGGVDAVAPFPASGPLQAPAPTTTTVRSTSAVVRRRVMPAV